MHRFIARLIAYLAVMCPLFARALPDNALVVNGSILTDTTWTKAQSPVLLNGTVAVRNGATLTIQPGVVVCSLNGGVIFPTVGELVITRGSQIFAVGTPDEPIIFTSGDDIATWDGTDGVERFFANRVSDFDTLGDPKTGSWRPARSEWRGLSLSGNAVISASGDGFDGDPNPPAPGVDNGSGRTWAEAPQQFASSNSPDGYYGGLDDDDDSGTLRHVSIRYAGFQVAAHADPVLNRQGLLLGGVGRETDISYVEVMNGAADGIRVSGGTVFLKHWSVWNSGDNALAINEGWRGGAQFGLIVQGYCDTNAALGSGASDHAVQADGAIEPDRQPRTAAQLRNLTVLSQQGVAGGSVCYRNNARLQVRRSIFINAGGHLIDHENDDGVLDEGYGYEDPFTLTPTTGWASTWTTRVADDPIGSEPNQPAVPFTIAGLYGGALSIAGTGNGITQDGRLNEIRDCVVLHDSALDVYGFTDPNDFFGVDDTVTGVAKAQVLSGTMYNVIHQGGNDLTAYVYTGLPIVAFSQGTAVTIEGGSILPYTKIDPRPAINALAVRDAAIDITPPDLHFSPFKYTGAFSPDHNWLDGWTAADAYGLIPDDFDPADSSDTDGLAAYVWQEPAGVTRELAAARIIFKAEAGKCYNVQCSTDGRSWTTIQTIAGRTGLVAVLDGIEPDAGMLYRVLVQ